MFVSGFTFINSAVRFDYPIVEAIQSIMPLCDEVVVAVGDAQDGTRALIEGIDSDKIRIVDTVWDHSLREGGRVLAVETDKAYAHISPKADWAVYIQGDEVLHEQDFPAIREAMERHLSRKDVDGLLFKYKHFYGSYDFVGASDRWYAHEVRVVRAVSSVKSFRDAQGFRIRNNEPLRVLPVDATVHHYGWVKPPQVMQDKRVQFNKLWHDDEWVETHVVGRSRSRTKITFVRSTGSRGTSSGDAAQGRRHELDVLVRSVSEPVDVEGAPEVVGQKGGHQPQLRQLQVAPR